MHSSGLAKILRFQAEGVPELVSVNITPQCVCDFSLSTIGGGRETKQKVEKVKTNFQYLLTQTVSATE